MLQDDALLTLPLRGCSFSDENYYGDDKFAASELDGSTNEPALTFSGNLHSRSSPACSHSTNELGNFLNQMAAQVQILTF